MEQTRLGRSGLVVSRVAFGTWQWVVTGDRPTRPRPWPPSGAPPTSA